MTRKQPDNSRGKINGVLTKHEIQKYELIKHVTESGTFEPIDSQKIQATTYDLCVGEAHFVYNENGEDSIYIGDDKEKFKLFESDGFVRQDNMHPNQIHIAPYGAALIQLDEIIDTYSVYNDHKVLIVGRFDLKLQKVSQGLLSQQATQVEPFYKGRLFCYIHNLSSKPNILQFEETFATIEFFYVSSSNNKYQQEDMIKILKDHNYEKYNKKHCLKEKDIYLGIKDIRYFLRYGEGASSSFGISHILKEGIDDYLNKKYDDIAATVAKKIDLKLMIINSLLTIFLIILYTLLTNNFSRADDSSPKNINTMQNSTLEQSGLSDILEDEVTE